MGELFADPPATVPPDPGGLLAALGAALSDDDLMVIAEADHGWRAEESYVALRAMARDGVVPRPLPFYPLEPLELTRWDEPPADPAGEARLYRHAFSCCALLRAYGDDETRSLGCVFDQNPTLAGLTMTLHHLSAPPLSRGRRDALAAMDRQAAALLAWLLPQVADYAEADYFALTLLWFSLAAGVPTPALEALIDWIMVAEAHAFGFDRILYRRDDAPRLWLLGRRDSDLRHHTWRALGALFPGRLRPEHGSGVVDRVRLIGAMLARGGAMPDGDGGAGSPAP